MARFNSTLPKAQCAAKRSTLKNAFCLSLNKLCFEGVDSAYPSLACHLTRTFNYTLGGLTRELKGKALAINGMEEHVHLLVSLPPTISVSDALRFIKANSCKWVHEKWPQRSTFAWQLGYGAFSVSKSNVPEVVDYIRNQEEHHRKNNYQEEFLALLRKHGVEYDERYVWD